MRPIKSNLSWSHDYSQKTSLPFFGGHAEVSVTIFKSLNTQFTPLQQLPVLLSGIAHKTPKVIDLIKTGILC
jgi:hypothetical protein